MEMNNYFVHPHGKRFKLNFLKSGSEPQTKNEPVICFILLLPVRGLVLILYAGRKNARFSFRWNFQALEVPLEIGMHHI